TAARLMYVEKTYPDVDFCLPTIMKTMNEESEEIINKWDVEVYVENGIDKCRLIDNGTTYIAQPFLCAVIRKICNAIGYHVELNQLEQTEFGSIYFPHAIQTTQYAEMFPGWTVKELFEEIEKLTNVSFFINSQKHSVQVFINNAFYKNAKLISIKNVIDTYQVEVDKEKAETLQESNVSYDLPEDEFYLLAKLKKSILNIAIRKSFDSYSSLSSYMRTSDDKTKVLALNLEDGREYVSIGHQIIKVNFLKDIEVENATNTIELHLIPAPFKSWYLSVISNIEPPVNLTGVEMSIPYIATQDIQEEEQDLNGTLYGLITENIVKPDEHKRELLIAFYQGLGEEEVKERFHTLTIRFPFSFIDYTTDQHDYKVPGGSLALWDIKKNYYNDYNINTTKEFKITSYDVNVYDPRGVFEINNKKYVCREMEYTLSKEGRKKAWTGTFYALVGKEKDINIDTSQWILADGNWRDNGVWLDNGRWLDE
ncbi:hypothetical protein EZS27_027725, partial [termite gut metagenome]